MRLTAYYLYIDHFFRYVTILYFLNEPPEGGETAFPMADNATFNKEVSKTFLFFLN